MHESKNPAKPKSLKSKRKQKINSLENILKTARQEVNNIEQTRVVKLSNEIKKRFHPSNFREINYPIRGIASEKSDSNFNLIDKTRQIQLIEEIEARNEKIYTDEEIDAILLDTDEKRLRHKRLLKLMNEIEARDEKLHSDVEIDDMICQVQNG